MTTKINYRPKSYKGKDGKWIPSGTITLSDSISTTEYTKEYLLVKKPSKEEADKYFIRLSKINSTKQTKLSDF